MKVLLARLHAARALCFQQQRRGIPAWWSAGFLRVNSRVATSPPPTSYTSSPHTQPRSKANTEVLEKTQTGPRLSPTWVSNPRLHLQEFQNGKRSMVFCKHVAMFTSDEFMCSCFAVLRRPCLSCPFELRMGKPFVARLRAARLPAPLRQELTAETSEQAGGQDSLLSDGCSL